MLASQIPMLVRPPQPAPHFSGSIVAESGAGNAVQSLNIIATRPRPASSVYSRGTDERGSSSPAMASRTAYSRASSIYPPTISPPDSPRLSDVNSSNPDISPISTTGPTPIWLRPSSIPIPASSKKQSPTESPRSPSPEQSSRLQAADTATGTVSGWRDVVRSMGRTPSPASQQARDSVGPTRWDTFSGEKTSDAAKGKTGAASPAQHPYKGTDPGFGYTAHISGGTADNGKPSHFLHVKLRKASDRKELPPTPEPWVGASGVRGPSGRTATVDPVSTRPVPPEKRHFPTPAERRAKGLFQRSAASGRMSPGPAAGLRSATPTERRELSQFEDKPSALRIITDAAVDSMRGMAAKAMQPRNDRPATSQAADGEVTVSETKVYKYRLGDSRTQSPTSPNTDFGPAGYRSLEATGRSATFPVAEYAADDGLITGGVNSYSVPTRSDSYRMSGVGMTAPSSAGEHEMVSMTHSLTTLNVIDARQSYFGSLKYAPSERSVSAPGTPMAAISGEDTITPLPGEIGATAQRPLSSILNRKRPIPSTSNQFKVKPTRKPAPGSSPEAIGAEPVAPKDRVTLLEEKLASLNKRKTSLTAVINELSNVTQPTSLAYDPASRAEIKKTVEGLKIEQDAVLMEIQELGIKLHRAYRKMDEEAGGSGGTGLWVRRVTE